MKRYFLFSGFFIFILFIIWEADHSSANVFFEFSQVFPYRDKIGHFVLYGILAFLLDKALKEKNCTFYKMAIPVSVVWVLSFAMIEEFTQIWIPARNFDLFDLAADIAGVSLFVASSRLIEIRIKKVNFFFIIPPKKSVGTKNEKNGC